MPHVKPESLDSSVKIKINLSIYNTSDEKLCLKRLRLFGSVYNASGEKLCLKRLRLFGSVYNASHLELCILRGATVHNVHMILRNRKQRKGL